MMKEGCGGRNANHVRDSEDDDEQNGRPEEFIEETGDWRRGNGTVLIWRITRHVKADMT